MSGRKKINLVAAFKKENDAGSIFDVVTTTVGLGFPQWPHLFLGRRMGWGGGFLPPKPFPFISSFKHFKLEIDFISKFTPFKLEMDLISRGAPVWAYMS
jgi:hypothetical protein